MGVRGAWPNIVPIRRQEIPGPRRAKVASGATSGSECVDVCVERYLVS